MLVVKNQKHYTLVGVEDGLRCIRLSQLSIRPHQPEPERPGRGDRSECETSITGHRSEIARPVVLAIKVGCVYVGGVGDHIDNREGHCLFLSTLAKRRRNPSWSRHVSKQSGTYQTENVHTYDA